MPRAVEGIERVLSALGKATKTDAINIAIGLDKCGDIILRAAMPFVPVEFGDLKETGRKTTTGSGFGAQTVVEFGGTAPSGREVGYALVVHEDLTAQHAPPTGAKYLTKAVNKTRGTCTALIRRQFLVRDPR